MTDRELLDELDRLAWATDREAFSEALIDNAGTLLRLARLGAAVEAERAHLPLIRDWLAERGLENWTAALTRVLEAGK